MGTKVRGSEGWPLVKTRLDLVINFLVVDVSIPPAADTIERRI
jgi:hypothetical protein